MRITVSHDVGLLRSWPNIIWQLEHGAFSSSNLSYHEFCKEQERNKAEIATRKKSLQKEHNALSRLENEERRRASQRKQQGLKKYGNDRTACGAAKERAGKNKQ